MDDHNFFSYYFSNLSLENKLKLKKAVIEDQSNVQGIDRNWLIQLIKNWEHKTLAETTPGSDGTEGSASEKTDL